MDDPNFVDAFNAYSRNGTASGLPVYVNFGQIEDFEVGQCYNSHQFNFESVAFEHFHFSI